MLDLNTQLLAELHPPECRCSACLAFWVENGPSDVSDEGEFDYGPFTSVEIEEASLVILLEDIDLSQLPLPMSYPDSLARVADLSLQDVVTIQVAEGPFPTCDWCGHAKPDVRHRLIERGSNIEEHWLCSDCASDAHT